MADTFSLLLGEWELRREIDDRRGGQHGVFEGTASVVADAEAPDSAVYEERGRIEIGAHQGPSHRALRLTRRADGGVDVAFADGRPFFALDLRSGACEAVHPCRADDYRLAFELRSHNLIIERWQVRGPAKDYDATTIWRRM